MKTAENWQSELNGETSVESYKDVQRDALIFALQQVIEDGNPILARQKILEKINTL